MPCFYNRKTFKRKKMSPLGVSMTVKGGNCKLRMDFLLLKKNFTKFLLITK